MACHGAASSLFSFPSRPFLWSFSFLPGLLLPFPSFFLFSFPPFLRPLLLPLALPDLLVLSWWQTFSGSGRHRFVLLRRTRGTPDLRPPPPPPRVPGTVPSGPLLLLLLLRNLPRVFPLRAPTERSAQRKRTQPRTDGPAPSGGGGADGDVTRASIRRTRET